VALEAGATPLLVGGECGIAPGAVAAISAATPGTSTSPPTADIDGGELPSSSSEAAADRGVAGTPVVVWLDAHGDLNTQETSPSGLLTGMPLALVLGRGHPDAIAVGEAAPRPRPRDTWLIGARDLNAGELATLAHLPIHHVTVEDLRGLGAEQLVERILPGVTILPHEAHSASEHSHTGEPRSRHSRASVSASGEMKRHGANVYLHIDVDSIDPSEAPGVAFPVPGGLSTAEVADLAGYLCASGRVAALTLASASFSAESEGRTIESLLLLATSIADALSLSAAAPG
jgi:arginase